MRTSARQQAPAGILILGLLLMVVYIAMSLILMDPAHEESGAALIVGPLLILVSVPIVMKSVGKDGDPRLVAIVLLALMMKVVWTLIRYYVTFEIYGGGDAGTYHREAIEIASRFREGNFDPGLPSLTGTPFISLITGVLYTVIGPTRLGGFLFFSWLGFWGLFGFYRAFVIAVPEGNVRAYAVLLFFFPSLLYWPSSIGKEAWMLFSLGLASYGVARALSGRSWRGVGVAALGLWFASLVRPHVAGMLGLGLVAGFLLLPLRREHRYLAPVGKIMGFATVAVLALVLVNKTGEFLGRANVVSPGGLVSELEQVSKISNYGGSQFEPIIVRTPLDVPPAIVTVLFRPFVTEANNAQALAAAVESAFLLVFSLLRIRWILAAVRSVRRQAYVAFAIVYTGLFVIAFASFPNFGLLARERVQLLPLYFVLLSIPLPRPEAETLGPRVPQSKVRVAAR